MVTRTIASLERMRLQFFFDVVADLKCRSVGSVVIQEREYE